MWNTIVNESKRMWIDLKRNWKYYLTIYLILIGISYATGVSMDTVMTWFALLCLVAAVVILIVGLFIRYKRKSR